MPYEFQRSVRPATPFLSPAEHGNSYKQFSLQFYTILMAHADDLQAVSVDEALIEVTNATRAKAEALEMELGDAHDRDPAKEVAESIRDAIRELTSCEGADS